MSWRPSWFGQQPQLDALQQQRLQAWKKLPPAPLTAPFNQARCVVVDVETSGLNLQRDRLISIGAVAVVNGQIALGDSFSAVLRQASPSNKENILLHGIGGAEQAEGAPAADALFSFLDYLDKDPLIAFHVTFDRTMIQRALKEYLGMAFKHPWLDLAYLMPALHPPLAPRYRTLDDWSSHFGIRNDARHNALSDALATAQLFQVALTQARKKNISDWQGLRDLEKAQRWVSDAS